MTSSNYMCQHKLSKQLATLPTSKVISCDAACFMLGAGRGAVRRDGLEIKKVSPVVMDVNRL